jgi:hypothetical protein
VACGESRPHNLWVNETTPDTINSPYYELDYTSDARCDWNIHAQDPGQVGFITDTAGLDLVGGRRRSLENGTSLMLTVFCILISQSYAVR